MIRVEVESGQKRGAKVESSADVLRIGRADGNDLLLTDDHVSGDHARLQAQGGDWMLHDLHSTNGTAVVRRGERHAVEGTPFKLESGDVIELGHGDQGVRLVVTFQADEEEDRTAQVLAIRSIDDIPSQASHIEQDTTRLRALYDAQKRIGAADDLSDVLVAIADAVLRARAARDARHDGPARRRRRPGGGRVRLRAGHDARARAAARRRRGPIPITRSVFRKVVSERAAVLAADAPREVGADRVAHGRVRSAATIGVPLWRGDEILGVLQVDNRESAGVFTAQDLERHARCSRTTPRSPSRTRAS